MTQTRPSSRHRPRNSSDPLRRRAAASPFAPLIRQMLEVHSVRVRRWRSSMSGCAWSSHYADGRTVNWIEAPLPRTEISLAVFLHEVGHHAIGFDRFRRRCEEEYHVWQWAIAQMQHAGIEPNERVMRRYRLSMQYAVDKAMRRGLTRLPGPLREFLDAA